MNCIIFKAFREAAGKVEGLAPLEIHFNCTALMPEKPYRAIMKKGYLIDKCSLMQAKPMEDGFRGYSAYMVRKLMLKYS